VLDKVEHRVAEAGNDAQAALLRQGGLDRSIHLALGNDGAELTRALTGLGAPVRAPLRPLPDNRYVAFEPVGEGGVGVVYLALATELNRRVAFKMVRPDAGTAATDKRSTPASPADARPPPRDTDAAQTFEELKSRFLQEAWVTGGLEHPGIVPVYELGRTGAGVPYYTMRFVRSQRTLAQAIDEARDRPWDERLALLEPFLKLCDTVRYAHSKGVVHRDLKPDNVALGEYGEVLAEVANLADAFCKANGARRRGGTRSGTTGSCSTRRWARFGRTPSAFSTCTATSGSGATTPSRATPRSRPPIRSCSAPGPA